MNVNINGYTDQFERFVSFAQAQASEGTVAKFASAPMNGMTVSVVSFDDARTGFAAGLRRQAEKDLNNSVRDLFFESVSEIFGGRDHIPANVLDALVTSDFSGSGKPLTARRILAVKRAVDDWKAENQLDANAQSRLALNRKVGDFIGLAQTEVVERIPFTRGDLAELQRTMQSLRGRVDEILGEVVAARPMIGDAAADAMVRELQSALNDAIASASEKQDWFDRLPDATSDENVRQFRKGWAEAAKSVFFGLVKHDNDACRAFADEIDSRMVNQVVIPDRKSGDFESFLSKTPEKFAEFVMSALMRRGVAVPASLGNDLKQAWMQTLNRTGWDPVRTDCTVSVPGKNGAATSALHSEITPAYHLHPHIQRAYDASGVKGVMCHSFESSHAVNLNLSTLTVEGDEAFRGFRHGVHCAIKVKDDAARRQANLDRVKETALAMVLSDANMRGLAEMGGTVIHLNISSVSLMTPDFWRNTVWGRKGTSDERTMLEEQTQAWKDAYAGGRGFQVTFTGSDNKDHTCTIVPQTRTFSFGVNGGAVGWLRAVTPNWYVSEAMNTAAWNSLKADAQRYAASLSLPANAYRKGAIETLIRQMDQILDNRLERSDGHDAYKAAARVTMLSYLIGDIPAWNCKSGKDRTGELDVEVKYLASLIAREQPIPEPGAPITDVQKRNFATIAFHSGNFEIQRYNTGLAGYKTSGVASIPERLGGAEMRKVHAGASKMVDI